MSVALERARGALATAALAILCVGSVSADTLRVPQDFATIQKALDAASNGDEIIVATGTYNEAIDFRGKAVNLHSADGASTAIIDATGLETSVVTCASGEGPETVLDGFTITGGTGTLSDDGEAFYGGGMYNYRSSPTVENCVFRSNVITFAECCGGGFGAGLCNYESTAKVTNCTFSDNAIGGFRVKAYGVGMCNYASDVEVSDCTFSGNKGGENGQEDEDSVAGAGMYNYDCSPLVMGCSFRGNSTSRYSSGGGVYNEVSNPTLIECEFTNNGSSSGGAIKNGSNSALIMSGCTFTGNGAWNGGAIFNSGDLTATECTFRENQAANDWGGVGGAILNQGDATLIDCTFVENRCAADDGGAGGGLYNSGALVLSGSTFSRNKANFGSGGGMYNGAGDAIVVNCIFDHNMADSGKGAGFYNRNGNPDLTNCAFTQNEAPYGSGGGMYIAGGNPRITNCTISRNTVVPFGTGSGMYVSNGTPTVANTIFWNDQPDEVVGAATVTFSNVQGGHNGTGNIDLDPDFADPDNGDFRLLNGSPCIDAGDNTAVPEGVTTDLDGKRRFENDPATEDTGNGAPPVVDMGAYELPHQWIDCNGNGIDDLQEIVDGTTPDCNANEVPDECDIADGTSLDVVPPGGNGIPDECESIHNITRDTYFSRIQFALNAAADGDEIVVATGTYNEAFNFWGRAAYLHSAEGPATTLLDGSGLDCSVVTFESAEGASAIIEGFTITGGAGTLNDGARRGGGVYISASSPTLINCIFSENVVGGPDAEGFGGGVYVVSGSPTLKRCTFHANRAKGGANRGLGGGMFNDASSPVLIHCTFDGNTVASFGLGGGMANANRSTPRIDECLFIRNEALAGGALLNSDSSHALVTGCTFTQNFAGSRGGAVYNMFDSFPTLTNVILWDDFPDEIARDPANVTYSDVQGGYAGTGNIDADPLFVDPGTGDLRLTADSPCIDAGDPNFAPPQGETDFDGHLRIWDGDGDGAAIVDMGVYEFGSFAYGDLNCDGGVDFGDIDAFVVALTGKGEYEKNYPNCEYLLADINADTSVDFDDIDSFVECLIQGGCR